MRPKTAKDTNTNWDKFFNSENHCVLVQKELYSRDKSAVKKAAAKYGYALNASAAMLQYIKVR